MFQLPKHEIATLPSVENWYTNTNILKLPPQAIMTRRKDKVGEDNQINDWIDESGDRVCEGVSKYSRGINPMVSVSYTDYNAGTNGNSISYSNKVQPHLPYKVMNNGAFRPPVLTEYDLLPLSRLPRNNVSVSSIPNLSGLSTSTISKTKDSGDILRSVKKAMLQTSVRSSVYMPIEKPLVETGHEKCSVKDTLIIPVNSGVRTLDIKDSSVGVQQPSREIVETPLNAKVLVNPGNHYTNYIDNEFKTDGIDKYIQDIINTSANTNVSNTYTKNIDYKPDTKGVKDEIALVSYNSGIKGIDKVTHYNLDYNLEKRLPSHAVQANLSDDRIRKNITHLNELDLKEKQPKATVTANIGSSDKRAVDTGSKEYKRLPEGLKKESFINNGFIPTFSSKENKSNDMMIRDNPTRNLTTYFQRYN